MAGRNLALCVLCALCGEKGDICVHRSAGETRRVCLDRVRTAQEALKGRIAWETQKAAKLSLNTSYDSGLPACRGRARRTVRSELPRELVGRSIAFAPAERMPAADLRAATSGRRLLDIRADLLADPALAERLGVRCSPTLVVVKSESELELVENP